MNTLFNPLTLASVSLVPIEVKYKEILRESAKFDKIWTNTTLMNKYTPELYDAWYAIAYNETKSGKRLCYIITYEDQPIGSSSYYGINHETHEISIGFTWITPEFWGDKINPICKLLLLQNAFDHGFQKVFFHTDIRNLHSQAAIKKLGAKLTKITKNDKLRVDGTMRDTVEFVIMKGDWLAVKSGLEIRIKN